MAITSEIQTGFFFLLFFFFSQQVYYVDGHNFRDTNWIFFSSFFFFSQQVYYVTNSVLCNQPMGRAVMKDQSPKK